jgi:hypothetical protein
MSDPCIDGGDDGRNSSDMELVRRALAREADAFQTIMRMHNHRVYRIAFARFSKFRGESALSTRLGRIVVNEASPTSSLRTAVDDAYAARHRTPAGGSARLNLSRSGRIRSSMRHSARSITVACWKSRRPAGPPTTPSILASKCRRRGKQPVANRWGRGRDQGPCRCPRRKAVGFEAPSRGLNWRIAPWSTLPAAERRDLL